jgi:hypothetical protein
MGTANLLTDVKRTVGREFSFKSGETFYWSPENNTIYYDKARLTEEIGGWSLLHELAHATLKHKNYNSDYDLLMMEVAAWRTAQGLAEQFGLEINQDHVDECLDTYRDWLHERSTCPTCSTVSLQASPTEYRCHNCHTTWHVSASRFCRPYRLRKNVSKQKSPGENARTTFV